ncbi:MAG: L-aspartate oxidase, partial [Mycobacteriales bacterium]
MALVRRLSAPAPTWQRETDVVIVGSGVAGLVTARDLRAAGLRVLIVTKDRITQGSTTWAQGGVAAAIDPGDTPALHLRDTLVAGAGLCDEAAVAVLVDEGRAAVRRLLAEGASFDRRPDGILAFTREGGHSAARIIHAGGDATGREVQRALEVVVSGIGVQEHAFALDLLRGDDGAATGVRVGLIDATIGECDSVGDIRAGAVVLATGGMGQLYRATSNPSVSTADGVALALRAGAEVADLEFVQFHPTVFFRGPGARGRQLLVSEAVRGEGATLIDATGARVMAGVHPLEDLAPRDVVALAISRRMAEAPGGIEDHVFLDARGIGAEELELRFPTILAGCRESGIDPVHEPIPVAPSAHYACGGVRSDMNGQTSIPGLYAAGEVGCTGVHGANRLASNSLLEGMVVGARVAGTSDATPSRPVRRTLGGGGAPAAGVV